jgi:hypothetical protein
MSGVEDADDVTAERGRNSRLTLVMRPFVLT